MQASTSLVHHSIDVDLRLVQRLRRRSLIDGLLVRRPGRYHVAVDVHDAPPAREVARMPLQVELTAPLGAYK